MKVTVLRPLYVTLPNDSNTACFRGAFRLHVACTALPLLTRAWVGSMPWCTRCRTPAVPLSQDCVWFFTCWHTIPCTCLRLRVYAVPPPATYLSFLSLPSVHLPFMRWLRARAVADSLCWCCRALGTLPMVLVRRRVLPSARGTVCSRALLRVQAADCIILSYISITSPWLRTPPVTLPDIVPAFGNTTCRCSAGSLFWLILSRDAFPAVCVVRGCTTVFCTSEEKQLGSFCSASSPRFAERCDGTVDAAHCVLEVRAYRSFSLSCSSILSLFCDAHSIHFWDVNGAAPPRFCGPGYSTSAGFRAPRYAFCCVCAALRADAFVYAQIFYAACLLKMGSRTPGTVLSGNLLTVVLAASCTFCGVRMGSSFGSNTCLLWRGNTARFIGAVQAVDTRTAAAGRCGWHCALPFARDLDAITLLGLAFMLAVYVAE